MDPLGFISICGNVILLMVGLILWAAAPPSARLLLKKKLGMMKNKTLNLIAWDDRVFTLEAEDVAPEGMLESRGKNGLTKSFYLAKSQDDTANTEQNIVNSQRDLDMIPPFSLDGVNIAVSYIGKAIATNPSVLTALHLANRIKDKKSPTEFKAKIAFRKPAKITLPAATTPTATVSDLEAPQTTGVLTNVAEVRVKLPWDPIDIKRNFPLYWQQSNIDATKRRNQAIGAEKEKREGIGLFKLCLIFGVIALGICVIGGVVISKLFGGG